MSWSRVSRLGLVLATALSAAACGGDETATGVTGPGTAGAAGKAGGSGAAGKAGGAGKAGTGGTGGAAGKAGTGGTGGAAGTATGGTAGTAGSAGNGGASGGGASQGGSAGQGGTGTSGTAGAAGATAGAAGSTAGAAGSTAGAAGSTAGAAGSTAGAAGNGGAGQAGTSQGGGGQGGDNTCGGGSKKCNGVCGPLNEPATGCSATECAPCAIPHATATCGAGACTIATCEFGFADCDGKVDNGCEVNVSESLTDCGKCGQVCGNNHATATCSAGVCGISACDAGYLDCNGTADDGCEVASASNTTHCGSCGNACNPGEQCEAGMCGTFCAPGSANCDGDASNACETTLGTAQACAGCGDTCTFTGGQGTCIAGKCSIATCNAPQADCDNTAANGCETNTQASVTNCGACGNECPTGDHATAACNIGTCAITCEANFGDCDFDPTTGCERPLAGDVLNCGKCGVACNTPNATPACSGGTCQVGTCNAGFSDCNGLPADGCEVNSGSSPLNCGTCNTVCPAVSNGAPACITGQCKAACNVGFADCDGQLATGCETNTGASVANCGTCGNVCSLPNAVAGCSTGACVIAQCLPGFADCDLNPLNGCEVNLQTNTNNCGTCANTCTASTGTPACQAGVCKITSCPANRADCDAAPGNGCEVFTNNDTQNCGSCGNTCFVQNGAPQCVNGSCLIQSCSAPNQDCDGQYATGCEANINTDVNNCGGCGVKCSAAGGTPTCNNGVCGINCAAGFGNCNGNAGDGCEVNLTNSATHCGACGAACAGKPGVAAASCQASACKVDACDAGTFNQDGAYVNGCECSQDTIGNTCGAATNLGTVNVDQALAPVVGNLVGAGNNDEDWYVVTFNVSASCNYNPRITLAAGSEPIKMQVYSNCAGNAPSGSMTCAVNEPANNNLNIDSWEYRNSATCGDKQPIDSVPDSGTYLTTPTTFYIRVLRTNGAATTCYPYQLNVSN